MAATTATHPELTLIVAATQQMGIGRNGALPWTNLRREMAYFARVTKRPQTQLQNAVVMGRRTWESIPPRFRPLPGRRNVVVSRSLPSSPPPAEGVVVARSLEEALASGAASAPAASGRVFVIGGAQIYGAALEMREARRVLLTRVRTAFECDTFFPLCLPDSGVAEKGWRRRGQAEMDAWVGEEVPRGVQEEAGTEYEFEMWERVD
ncbi:dihydrofolate reductase-like domain-containing protein [Chaetomium fimeti]|uniref:Dihydrofolate reductase n=1 Tax=Chaetomium fimeti TaxID=1854472 RepID=A0AAE0HH23_9PEZI|nr:dihydrofolate reductase-like domain-containing protein [Chaetomium fimeti]